MNMFKVSGLMALMVLGSSVYGMADKELGRGLLRSAQPIAEPVFPATPRCPGAGALPIYTATPDRSPAASAASTPQSTPERDVESGEVIAKKGCLSALKSRIGGWLKPCADLTKRCWSGMPRWGKDAVEIGGLLAVDTVFSFEFNNYFSILTAYAIGQSCAEITERHRYYLKVLAGTFVWGGCWLLNFGCGADLWAVSLSAIMYVIQSTFEDYAILSGRKNTFTEDFRDLPINLQRMVVDRIAGLARQVRALRNSGAAIPLQPMGQVSSAEDSV